MAGLANDGGVHKSVSASAPTRPADIGSNRISVGPRYLRCPIAEKQYRISALGTCQCAVYGALLVIAASAIKRDNIDFLSVLGKLTEMRNGSPKTKPH